MLNTMRKLDGIYITDKKGLLVSKIIRDPDNDCWRVEPVNFKVKELFKTEQLTFAALESAEYFALAIYIEGKARGLDFAD